MSFSYSGITNYGKTTLPSVEGWSTNLNMLRDPPRSITTRRIDKVGDTNAISESIDGAGDRSCEAILTYARGVNPMVSVSYSNNGNNGGQGVGQNQTQAYSSRTIMKDGEFRPPVMTKEELMPLSRQPRISTTASTQPGFVDFSKKMRTCGTSQETKEVKNKMLHAFVRPTAVYQVEKPIEEPFEVKYVIKPTLRTSTTSGIRTMDLTNQHVLEPTKEVNRNMVYATAHANVGSSQNYVNNSMKNTDPYTQDTNSHSVFSKVGSSQNYVNNSMKNTDPYTQDTNAHSVFSKVGSSQNYVNNSMKNTDPYTQDTNAHSVFSNAGSDLNITNIEEVVDLSDVRTKDIRNVNYNTAVSGTDQSSYIHKDIELTRSIPEYKAHTNTRQNIHKTIDKTNSIELERNTPLTTMTINPGNFNRGNSDNSSREYRLSPKIQPGGYSAPTQVPMRERMQDVRSSQDSEKSRMSRAVIQQFQGRYTN